MAQFVRTSFSPLLTSDPSGSQPVRVASSRHHALSVPYHTGFPVPGTLLVRSIPLLQQYLSKVCFRISGTVRENFLLPSADFGPLKFTTKVASLRHHNLPVPYHTGCRVPGALLVKSIPLLQQYLSKLCSRQMAQFVRTSSSPLLTSDPSGSQPVRVAPLRHHALSVPYHKGFPL